MIFDALTLAGILTAALAGGFFIYLTSRNGTTQPSRRGVRGEQSRG